MQACSWWGSRLRKSHGSSVWWWAKRTDNLYETAYLPWKNNKLNYTAGTPRNANSTKQVTTLQFLLLRVVLILTVSCANDGITSIVLRCAWTLYNVYCLIVNYSKTSELDLSQVICSMTPSNPLWTAFQTAFRKILRFFPFAATSFTRHCRLRWKFHDHFRTHAKLGDVWMLVTPARNRLYATNAEAVTEIFGRGRDFTRLMWMLGTSPCLVHAWI